MCRRHHISPDHDDGVTKYVGPSLLPKACTFFNTSQQRYLDELVRYNEQQHLISQQTHFEDQDLFDAFCTDDVEQPIPRSFSESQQLSEIDPETPDTLSSVTASPASQTDSQDGLFICHICARRYSTLAKLDRHMKRHMPSRLCPMQACGILLLDQKEIVRHVALHHPEFAVDQNACPAGCGKKFPGRTDALRRHLRSSRHISKYGAFTAS